MSIALGWFRYFNPNAYIALDESQGIVVAIEDVQDSPEDGRLYRMEYQSTYDGSRAIAICRYSPWGRFQPYDLAGHVNVDGVLCLGDGATLSVHGSPFTVNIVVPRARYWVTAFSYFKETGTFPQP